MVLPRNDMLTEVLSRSATLELPGWYVTAGCLFQTVWNVVMGRPPTNGIKDYDLFYFDSDDLSWEAEDTVIKTGRNVFARPARPRARRPLRPAVPWAELAERGAYGSRLRSRRPRLALLTTGQSVVGVKLGAKP
ncbi:nucleotidyltransferase family protein [Streptomyces sp. enrichment culture]|uniref:nucleotidyltransferase family protein n=1 Tax=Streptomyces sp. enrichment culture TaxID=1795815 RepID=UPI003F54D4D3